MKDKKISEKKFYRNSYFQKIILLFFMGADENSAPELHQQFHNQADGAMGAMNGMIMGRSGFQPDMDLVQRQRTIQNMALMQLGFP